jgi:hypothetical protein
MLAAIVLSLGISFYQDSRIAMEALEKLNEPLSTVLRNGEPNYYCSNCNRRSSNCRIQLMPMENLHNDFSSLNLY